MTGASDILTDRRVVAVSILALFLVVVGVAFGAGRCSAPSGETTTILAPGIDAGPGDRAIADRLDAAVRAEDERLAELEAAHRQQIDELEAADRAEFERIRARGRDALARWFKDRSRRLLEDAGR